MTAKKKKEKDVGGRPPMFSSPKEMKEAIESYFHECPDTTEVIVGGEIGTVVIPAPTITGLALHLGFCDRHSMYDYENKKGFAHTIKKARAFMVQIYEQQVQWGKNPAGAIFMLKNFGYSDKQEIEMSGEQTMTVKQEDINDRLDNLLKEDGE